jgi:methyl-accepting chemotaxis protein
MGTALLHVFGKGADNLFNPTLRDGEHAMSKKNLMEEGVLRPVRAKGDRIMTGVCWFLWAVSLGFAALHGTWELALIAGTLFAGTATALAVFYPGKLVTRLSIALIFMAFSGLLIDEAHGMIETHFSIFALLAFLLFYRDWKPVCAAAGSIAVHHYVACVLQMRGYPIYVFPTGHSCDMVYVHAAYVIAETAVLVYLGMEIRREAVETGLIAKISEGLVQHGKIDLSDEVLSMGTSRGLVEFLRAIDHAVDQAGCVAKGIGDVSENINAAASHMLRIGHEQQSSVEHAVDSVWRMAGTAEHMTRNCKEVAEVARRSNTSVEGGRETMRNTARIMETLAATVESVSSEMNELNKESGRIEEIIKIIADISVQTNLLALNATIEAARAGDAGRGFHVVAQEIRALSLRTHTCLAQAQNVVGQVRSQTTRVCTIVDACRTEAQRGGTQVEQANQCLEDAVRQLPQAARRAEEAISEALRYTGIAEEVVEQMQGIGIKTAENSTNLERMDSLGHSLGKMAVDLCESITLFEHGMGGGTSTVPLRPHGVGPGRGEAALAAASPA